MSFNVFASGSGFHYKKDDLIDKDDFDALKVVSTLTTMELSAPGVVNAGIDYKKPDMTDLMETIATSEILHTLIDGVSLLATCSGASDGWISVSCTRHQLLWPDTKSFGRYNFSRGDDDPGAEFIRAIGPALKATNMNNYGVLAALSIVLAKFSDYIGQNGTPMINIMLDR